MASFNFKVFPDHYPSSDGFLNDVGGSLNGAIKVTNVNDMVTKVVRRLRPGDCINQLDIIGHGNQGLLVVGGSQKSHPPSQEINGVLRNLNRLNPLIGKFCAGGELRLLGCLTGVCTKGADKMRELANLLNVKVTGTRRNIDKNDFGRNGFTGPASSLISAMPGDTRTGCLAPVTASGLRRSRHARLLSAYFEENEIVAMALHDHGRYGPQSPSHDTVRAITEPKMIEQFLAAFDFSKAYEADGLAAAVNIGMDVLYENGWSRKWDLMFGGLGLVITKFGNTLLYLAKDYKEAGESTVLVSSFLAIQEAMIRHIEVYEGLSVGANDMLIQDPNVLNQFREDYLVPRYRKMKPETLLSKPITIIRGINSVIAMSFAKEFNVKTIADLDMPGGRAELSMFARLLKATVRRDRK